MSSNSKILILGSSSPRRRELLSYVTDVFEVITCDVDERAIEEKLRFVGTPAVKVSEALASAKARAVLNVLPADKRARAVVIGADTSVIMNDVIYGKPEDENDARRMLLELSGKRHVVATGVSIVSEKCEICFTEQSLVEFNPLDDFQRDLIERYVKSGDPMDKAGAYGIQNGGALLVKGIDGDFFNVVGLPVARLARELTSVYDILN